jgi:hypothetical protein
MSQTSVLAGGQPIGVAGQLADNGPFDIVSGFNEATTQLPFGFGVRQGTSRDMYILPTGTSGGAVPVVGLVSHDFDHSPAGVVDSAGNYSGDLGASGLLQYAKFGVARKGRFLVPVEASPSVNDRAWCRSVATGGGVSSMRGIWRGSPQGTPPLSGSYHVDCSNNGVFRSTAFTAADGTTLVAVMEVDFTSKNT